MCEANVFIMSVTSGEIDRNFILVPWQFLTISGSFECQTSHRNKSCCFDLDVFCNCFMPLISHKDGQRCLKVKVIPELNESV